MARLSAIDETEVARRAAGTVHALAPVGRGPETRVALLCKNGVDHISARAAVAALGWVAVPLSPKLLAAEITEVLEHAGPAALIHDDSCAAVAQAGAAGFPNLLVLPASRGAELPLSQELDWWRVGATLLYTSGTTGRPKGCLRREPEETARAREIISSYSLTDRDLHLVVCPLSHSAPGIFLRAARAVSATTVVLDGFSAETFADHLTAARASIAFVVPTQLARLLALPVDHRKNWPLPDLRALVVAGAPMPASLSERVRDWVGDRLWEFYGSSETGTISVRAPNDPAIHTVGRPVTGAEVEIRAGAGEPIGEIHVRSPTLMTGYLERDGSIRSPTDASGFMTVGDLGRKQGDHLVLVERRDDVIITGGVNVYPSEVERALGEFSGVSAAMVFGIDSPDWGQEVSAVVAGADLDLAQLAVFLRARLAGFKRPKAIGIVDADELPLSSSGKPLRREAIRRFAGDRRLRRLE